MVPTTRRPHEHSSLFKGSSGSEGHGTEVSNRRMWQLVKAPCMSLFDMHHMAMAQTCPAKFVFLAPPTKTDLGPPSSPNSPIPFIGAMPTSRSGPLRVGRPRGASWAQPGPKAADQNPHVCMVNKPDCPRCVHPNGTHLVEPIWDHQNLNCFKMLHGSYTLPCLNLLRGWQRFRSMAKLNRHGRNG